MYFLLKPSDTPRPAGTPLQRGFKTLAARIPLYQEGWPSGRGV